MLQKTYGRGAGRESWRRGGNEGEGSCRGNGGEGVMQGAEIMEVMDGRGNGGGGGNGNVSYLLQQHVRTPDHPGCRRP